MPKLIQIAQGLVHNVEGFIEGPVWNDVQILLSDAFHDTLSQALPIAKTLLGEVLADPTVVTSPARVTALLALTLPALAKAGIEVEHELAVQAAALLVVANAPALVTPPAAATT